MNIPVYMFKLKSRHNGIIHLSGIFFFLLVIVTGIFQCKSDREKNNFGVFSKTRTAYQESSEKFEDQGFSANHKGDEGLASADMEMDSKKSENDKTNLNLKSPSKKDVVNPKKLIKTGNISVEVKSFHKAVEALKKSVSDAGGYVENENSSRDINDRYRGQLKIRVPAEKFDVIFNSFGGIGKVGSQHSFVEDVTMEYQDSVLRLENQINLRTRLQQLLETRAGKLSEVVELEGKLAAVTGEIESIKGKIRYYDHNISLSLINADLYEPEALDSSATPFWRRIAGSFYNAWDIFIGFIVFFISSLGILIPLGAIGYPLYKRFIRYKKEPGWLFGAKTKNRKK